MSDEPNRTPPETPGYAIVFGILTVPIALIVLLVIAGGVALMIESHGDRPRSPSYSEHPSPCGKWVAIVGRGVEYLDPLHAVWIARPGTAQDDWHEVIRWHEHHSLTVEWQGERLVVFAQPSDSRAFEWNGVTIDVR